MIISQTPLRISFVGGGTDLEDFWKLEDGKVLSTAIDKYIYVIVKERFDDLIYINYSRKEIIEDVSQIKHDLVREAMRTTGVEKGVEITTLADIPSEGSGLGSSSSVIVGLLNALYAYKGEQVTAERLAREACQIEIDILGRPIGKQDQYIAAYGGLKEFIFHPDGSVTVKNVNISNGDRRVFGSNILLFFTNMTRKSSFILKDQKKNTRKNFDILRRMRDQVDEFKAVLENGYSFDRAGQILHEAWLLKQKLDNKISNETINDMYMKAINAGALGGKVCGAGGGGFLMLYVPREKQNSVRKALKEYRELPFMLEPDGSKIIFNIKRNYWK
ncbi:MAG: GHMP kinase [Candidatus Marinimicrobia bacterium]|nr:GHMP kinase [Candidatus Neomarinimicrobiota bacterium]